jgi:hypothetical protein
MSSKQINLRKDALQLLDQMKDEIAAIDCRPVETVSYTDAVREMHRRMRGTPV